MGFLYYSGASEMLINGGYDAKSTDCDGADDGGGGGGFGAAVPGGSGYSGVEKLADAGGPVGRNDEGGKDMATRVEVR